MKGRYIFIGSEQDLINSGFTKDKDYYVRYKYGECVAVDKQNNIWRQMRNSMKFVSEDNFIADLIKKKLVALQTPLGKVECHG